MKTLSVYFSIASLVILGCFANNKDSVNSNQNTQESSEKGTEAILGGGCFWCTEGAFKGLYGVESALPAYAGGHDPNPRYEPVCAGTTGHAEIVEVVFDPDLDVEGRRRVW